MGEGVSDFCGQTRQAGQCLHQARALPVSRGLGESVWVGVGVGDESLLGMYDNHDLKY